MGFAEQFMVNMDLVWLKVFKLWFLLCLE